MYLKTRPTKSDGHPAVTVVLVAEAGDEALWCIFAPSMKRIVRDLVAGKDVLLRDLCTPAGIDITLRDGEREIDLVHAICIELHHVVDAIGPAAHECVRRLYRLGDRPHHRHLN